MNRILCHILYGEILVQFEGGVKLLFYFSCVEFYPLVPALASFSASQEWSRVQRVVSNVYSWALEPA